MRLTKAKKNLSYEGMSGMVIDEFVAKTWKGKYVVGSEPQFPEKRRGRERSELVAVADGGGGELKAL
ncbi:MAG: hypothetical protein KAU99_01225 [Thermoplasmata archaeon]|nr:hypothetical protein [Thermoplasmata archaeon]MCK4454948.1 hypothetical protein [Thermoplasmata archaeon]